MYTEKQRLAALEVLKKHDMNYQVAAPEAGVAMSTLYLWARIHGLARIGKCGRRPVTQEKIDRVRELYQEVDEHGHGKHTVAAIADFVGLGESTVYKYTKGLR